MGVTSYEAEEAVASSLFAKIKYYRNIHAMLLLVLTLPVGSCSCERSFSALRPLRKFCCNTEERLDAVAMGHVNHERSAQGILQVWDRSGHIE